MSAITFYHNPMSRGQIVRWALEESGAPYEQRIISYENGMKSADYLQVNLMGKVPAIVHNGHIVTECAAICAYLADAFPEAELAPAPGDRADYYRWLFFAAGPLEQAVVNTRLGWLPTQEQQRTVGYGSYEAVLDTLEAAVRDRPFIAAPHFTAADVYVGSHLDWGMLFGTIEKRPAFEAYVAPLRERDAYQRAKAIDGALIEQMQKG